MPTADSHLHIFADGFTGELGTSPSGGDELAIYEQLRHEYGIERGLVLAFEGKPQYIGNTTYVLELARTHPWMAPLAHLDCAPAPTVETLQELHRAGARGVAVYPLTGDEGSAIGAWPAPVLAELNTQRAIVSINAGPAATTAVTPAVEQMENCTVLFSHLGQVGPWTHPPTLAEAGEVLQPLLALAGRQHIAVKFSGLYGVSEPPHDFPHTAAQPVIDLVLDGFGPGRLMWGSDYAPLLDFVTFVQAADTRLLGNCSPAEVDGIMGGNLLRLLNAR